MPASTSRFAVVIGLAGTAGVLHGLGPGIPLLVDPPILGYELAPAEIGPILSFVGLLTTAVSISIFFGGYWWAGQAEIPSAYGRFAGSLFVAAFFGHSLAFLPLFLLRSDQSVVMTLGLFGVLAVSLLSVPVPGLAGGAIAQYRSVTTKS